MVASLTSVQFSIVSGGLGCVAVMVLPARWLPGFANDEAPREQALAA